MILSRCVLCMWFLKRFIIYYLLLERGREGEREGEKHQCVVATRTPPAGDLACNPGICPDWELNWWPFGSQTCTQSTERYHSGLVYVIFIWQLFLFSGAVKGIILLLLLWLYFLIHYYCNIRKSLSFNEFDTVTDAFYFCIWSQFIWNN